MKQRKMPLRKCTGCGEMKEKRELIRVVKAPDTKDENGEIIAKGEISLDLTGRKAGREILPALKRLARHAALNAH